MSLALPGWLWHQSKPTSAMVWVSITTSSTIMPLTSRLTNESHTSECVTVSRCCCRPRVEGMSSCVAYPGTGGEGGSSRACPAYTPAGCPLPWWPGIEGQFTGFKVVPGFSSQVSSILQLPHRVLQWQLKMVSWVRSPSSTSCLEFRGSAGPPCHTPTGSR